VVVQDLDRAVAEAAHGEVRGSCCGASPCVAVSCSVCGVLNLHCCSSVLQCVAVCDSVLHCVAVCCSVWQCVAVC